MKPLHFATAAAAAVLIGGLAYATLRTCCAAPGERRSPADVAWISTGPIPDFSSGGVSWDLDSPSDGTNSAFLKVPGDAGPGPILQHPDYPYDRVSTRRMADTSNPVLKPEVKAK